MKHGTSLDELRNALDEQRAELARLQRAAAELGDTLIIQIGDEAEAVLTAPMNVASTLPAPVRGHVHLIRS